ncbi:deoxyguanosinetriphosphate triphosphohydrolase family protein [Haloplasma contractile]|uniref:HD superfamily hydrolase ral function prediction only protein n=1 Tax=Haloplasma contractile SSD-17B TaxID=1033810 RepID=U2FGB3_9MOLU|nr:dNTP triphosphohydrolase [Haloplasma contractile]ERJ11920.1 putative HD superfamily hydrolase ral function prediction only protein [Haloplasma contractile SSD-17B]
MDHVITNDYLEKIDCYNKFIQCNIKRDQDDREHPYRTPYQRDRDRILYTKSFRSLSGKTQLFLANTDDHTRTRLTHSIEVAQLSQTIAKALHLDESLAEAIALGHDLGHTPFGHVGERTLHSIMNGTINIHNMNMCNNRLLLSTDNLGYKHNSHSVYTTSKETNNLNLTYHTLWGFLFHTKVNYEENRHYTLKYNKELGFYKHIDLYKSIEDYWSLEALVVECADEIAQRHHDIEDALEYYMISHEDIISKISEIFDSYKDKDNERITGYIKELKDINERIENQTEEEEEVTIRHLTRFIVNILVSDLIENSIKTITREFPVKGDQIKLSPKKLQSLKLLRYSNVISDIDEAIKKYLKNTVLYSHKAQIMDGRGKYIIKRLFKAYTHNPQQLPDRIIEALYRRYWHSKGEEVDKKINVGEKRADIQELHEKLKVSIEKMKSNMLFSGNYNQHYLDSLFRTVCHYIASMTDSYANRQHRLLYNIID